MLQTVELLHQSDKSTVALVIDTETGKKVVRKDAKRGWNWDVNESVSRESVSLYPL